ncbi:MAG: hypothetical protein RSB65_07630, partial [Oscillospiraceae bacterium]
MIKKAEGRLHCNTEFNRTRAWEKIFPSPCFFVVSISPQNAEAIGGFVSCYFFAAMRILMFCLRSSSYFSNASVLAK